ncbi:Mdm20p [Nakaseomyces bracarensis]|uniref:Mdm20p n=1 Tax=Nakaseomyces bracarensis TaxID=273131 RepID=UPI0038715D4A
MSEKIEGEVLELIKRSNFKQCYDYLGKLRKQYPRSAFLLALELYVKYRHSASKFQIAELDSIETSESYALSFLYKFYVELGEYSKAIGVYEHASTKFPSYETAYLWFGKALSVSDYQAMGRACLQLAKYSTAGDTSLTKRDYLLWHSISIVALFKWKKHSVTDQEMKILPLLCLKNLESIKPFKSMQEVVVFCNVCETLFDDKSELIVQEILPTLDESVDLYLKNFLLTHATKLQPEKRYQAFSKILSNIDDFSVIEALLQAGKELDKSQKEVLGELKSLIGDSRNYGPSALKADIIYNGKISKETLRIYVKKFHNKPCCTFDLKTFEGNFDDKDLLEVFKEYNDDDDILHDYNEFKLGLVGDDKSNISLYNKHKKTMKVKSKTLFSKCSAFILDIVKHTIAEDEQLNLSNILFSITLLENYQGEDPYNYETRLWLVALYMYIGAAPLAYAHFKELNVKNVQVDSMEYILYSRFSTMFPRKEHDYLKTLLANPANLYETSMERLPVLLRIAFERKSYSKILGMLDFNSKLQSSFYKWNRSTEILKFSRLNNDKRGPAMNVFMDQWREYESYHTAGFSDNRDISIFTNSKNNDGVKKLLWPLHPDKNWLFVNIIQELMLDSTGDDLYSRIISKLLKQLENEDKDYQLDLTSCEQWTYDVIKQIYRSEVKDLKPYIEKVAIASDGIPIWETIHSYLQYLTTLKTLDNLKKIKDKDQKKLIKDKMKYLRDNCDDLFSKSCQLIKNEMENLKASKLNDIITELGYEHLDANVIVDSLKLSQKTIRNF